MEKRVEVGKQSEGKKVAAKEIDKVIYAHLIKKIPELFLSLHNLLPVFYLLIFYMLLLQPTHIQTH